jgi:metallo-beta-lactamase class B
MKPRKLISTFSMLLVLCLPTIAAAQATAAWRSWNQPVKPFRIIGNVWYVGASDVTAYLITTPAGHILLDSGFLETVPLIKQSVAQLGFKLADIKILINSHAHSDHAGGLAELKQLTGATLMISEPDAPLLASGGKGDPQFGDSMLFAPVKADRLLRDGDEVKLGDTTLTAHITPGHTKGSTTWTMKVREEGKAYDVVFASSVSTPEYKLVGNDKHPHIVDDYRRTFRVMKALPCDVFLGPHARFFDMESKRVRLDQRAQPNPFIDAVGYRRYVVAGERAFEEELKMQLQAASQKSAQERR